MPPMCTDCWDPTVALASSRRWRGAGCARHAMRRSIPSRHAEISAPSRRERGAWPTSTSMHMLGARMATKTRCVCVPLQ
eukprot:3013269-Pyramimonas_sp.AAC.1